MIHLARLSVRRPLWSLIAWVLVAIALTVVSFDVTNQLSPTVTTVAGTQSAKANNLAEQHFGPQVLVPILLQGPQAQLNKQGPALVQALSKRSDTKVLSAWSTGSTAAQFRPGPDAAMVLASVARTEKQMVKTYQAQIDRTVSQTISSPVRASITGTPTIHKALQDQAVHTAHQDLYITAAVLFVLLILLLRAPVAAAALTVLGVATAFSSMGVMTLLAHTLTVDGVALTSGMLTGLALGVGYGLLIYRRWQAELHADGTHHDAGRAAVTAVETSGRAVLVGGSALTVALLLAPVIADTKIVTSIGIGALLCSIVAVGAAVVVMPAFLVLAGARMEAFSFGLPGFLARAWERVTAGGGWVVRYAVPAVLASAALLVLLAIPMLSLDTGPPTPKVLPKDDSARVSYERVAQVMGPGWPTPYSIVVVSNSKPITDSTLLTQIDNFQKQIAKDPRVASVTGPGQFAAVSQQLNVLPQQLNQSKKLLTSAPKNLGRLEAGLGQAHAGAGKLQSGLVSAVSGANQVHNGSGAAQSGAGQLHSGLVTAQSGSAQISTGLGTALAGATKLRDGANAALNGSSQITAGLKQASGPVKAGAPLVSTMAQQVTTGRDQVNSEAATASTLTGQLDSATSALQSLPTSSAQQSALSSVESARSSSSGLTSSLKSTGTTLSTAAGTATAFASQTNQLAAGLDKLYTGSQALQNGILQLRNGNAALATGIAKLNTGGGQLTSGLTKLRNGAGALQTGLGTLTSGSGQLASGLAAAPGPTGQLVSGLGQLQAGVTQFGSQLPSPKGIEQLETQSPGLFNSGYFTMAAIAGAPPDQQVQASFLVNVNRGGNAGQIAVIPKQAIDSTATKQLTKTLQNETATFAAQTKTEAAVGGTAGQLTDFTTATQARILPLVVVTALVVAALMMLLLRAVILPLIAVAFDVLTCGAAFGVLALLYTGGNPPFGGPGYIDPMSIVTTFAFVFGITMFYEVQLLSRTRELYAGGMEARQAVRAGLDRTAAATTGAAVAMIAASIPFAATDGLLTVQMFAVALLVALLLDAIIVRPVLLPAAIRLTGARGWWPTRCGPAEPAEAPTATLRPMPGRGAA